MSIFGYRKRVFLGSISTGHTSYILTEVESSRGGEYKWGHSQFYRTCRCSPRFCSKKTTRIHAN